MTQRVVDDVAVEVDLAGEFRPEGAGLQVDHDECTQFQMIEQQINVIVAAIDLDAVLPPDEGEALAQLEQEFLQVMDQAGFQLAFVERLCRA